MIARGKVRKLIKVLGTIQGKVGLAKGLFYMDITPGTFERAIDLLEEVFDLCVKERGNYDPVEDMVK